MSGSHRNKSKAYSPCSSHTRSKASQQTMTSDKESYVLDYFHNTSYKQTKNAKKQNKVQTHFMTTSSHQRIAFRVFNDHDLGFLDNIQEMITTQRIDNDMQTQDQLIQTQIQHGANELQAAIKLNNRETARKMRKIQKQEKRLSRSQTKGRRGTK